MNTYSFDQIAVGRTEAFPARLSEREMRLFREITGDQNPLHTEQHVAYGMLMASYLSTLAGMYLPGLHALIQTVHVDFLRPVQLSGEEGIDLTVSGTVIEEDERFLLLTLNVSITDAAGKKYLRGTMKVKVRDDA
jgi:3-hydroxybutyryl-CoA dehydratase